MSYRNIIGGLTLLCLCACGGSSEDKRIYKEAFEKQEQVIALIEEVEELLDNEPASRKDSLSESIHEIEESLFEIPGYHLELPGHEGHDHGHQRVELTPKEILDIQVDLLQQLKDIKYILSYDK